MERTIKWEAGEAAQMTVIEQEKTQILAQIGALMMDLETVKKRLDGVNDRQRAAIQTAIQAHGIQQFESARPIQGGVVLQIPDVLETSNGNAGRVS